MKKVKKVFLVFFLLVLFIGITLVIYGFYLQPKYKGSIELENIKENTTVYFDDYGIPHIYASSQKDAMIALGYVHAQDRLWQMELIRRIAPGRLSEIFGSKTLKVDLFFAGIGIEEASEKAITQLDVHSESYQLASAYLEGINQYIEDGPTPIEFQLLGLSKQKFTLKDVYNVFGYMSFSFAMAQKTDPLLTDIRDKFGMSYLEDFGIDSSLNTTRLKSYKGKSKEYSKISKAVTSILEDSPVPQFIGSNSWVIGPQKTKNGKVIFANDPHISFSQPGTWYEAHISTPDYEMYGYYLAGTPFPLLGHNRQYAYGLTMFENDDIDFYEEQNHPKNNLQYKTSTGFKTYDVRKKVIKVKDSVDVHLEIKISSHGPIVNLILDGMSNNNPTAMSWIYTQHPIKILDATYSLCHAKDVDDFRKNISLIAAPGLNIMYGDADGNISWTTSGKLYKHDARVNTNFILDGASGKDDIKEYLDFSKNPQALNPSWNYVYSANNQPEAIDGFLYPGYYLPEDRAKRISNLLEPKNNWTKEDVGKMITDNTSSTAQSVVKEMLQTIDYAGLTKTEREAYGILHSWKATNRLQDIGPTIFNKWMYLYLKNTFRDELGAENFNLFMSTHVMKQLIAAQVKNDNSPWWDNILTKNRKETRKIILEQSFKEAVLALQKQLGPSIDCWTWNRVHTVEYQHPMGKVAVLRSFFNIGPFEISGSNEVIDNQMFPFTEDGDYKVTGGPSTRRVIDFSDVENSWSIVPTGQSGNILSNHYSDQAEMYRTGKFRKMKMNKDEIIRTSSTLVFIPKNK